MKRTILILLTFFIMVAPLGCAKHSQNNNKDNSIKTVTQAKLIQLQAIALSMEYPEGGEHALSDCRDSKWNPILEIISFDEETNTYSVKVDPRLIYGFTYFVVTEEEFNSIKAWEKENGKQILYPSNNPNNNLSRNDADFWYLVSDEGVPIDENGNEIPYSEDMKLIPNYKYDKSGNICYQIEMVGNTYKIRVCVYNYFEFRFGKELTFPLSTDEEAFLHNR